MQDLLKGSSKRYTLADTADDFDKFDHNAVEMEQQEGALEDSYKLELQRQKVSEVTGLAQLLTKRVQALTASEDNHNSEILALYDKVQDVRTNFDSYLAMEINDGDENIARK